MVHRVGQNVQPCGFMRDLFFPVSLVCLVCLPTTLKKCMICVLVYHSETQVFIARFWLLSHNPPCWLFQLADRPAVFEHGQNATLRSHFFSHTPQSSHDHSSVRFVVLLFFVTLVAQPLTTFQRSPVHIILESKCKCNLSKSNITPNSVG
jgi:hypothetical protein